MYILLCTYIYIQIFCKCIYMCTYYYVHIYIYRYSVNVYIYIYVCTYYYVHIYIQIFCKCIYIYIYIFIYVHKHHPQQALHGWMAWSCGTARFLVSRPASRPEKSILAPNDPFWKKALGASGYLKLVGGWAYPSEKYESQWEGWHPICYGQLKMFQTTNQYIYLPWIITI